MWRWSIYNIYKYIYKIYTVIYTIYTINTIYTIYTIYTAVYKIYTFIYTAGGQLRWRHVLRLGGVAALVQLLRLLWHRAEVEAAAVRGAQQGPGEL